MSKFYGVIGFRETVETAPGVTTEEITEHYYYGDWTRNSNRYSSGQKVNDDITISNTLSIVADEFAQQWCGSMVYVKYMGCKWKVSSVEIQHPRLIIQLGGVYHG